jgi:hypothetical protein
MNLSITIDDELHVEMSCPRARFELHLNEDRGSGLIPGSRVPESADPAAGPICYLLGR